jgi:hypothetical protein
MQNQIVPGAELPYEGIGHTVANWTRHHMKRPLMPMLFTVLGACATQYAGESTGTARFPEFPAKLFTALEATCTDPAQQYVRLSTNVAECREFLEPQATAAIILTYEGTTENLPRMVIRLTARPDGQEYLLTTDAYLNVPQKDQSIINVAFPSHGFGQTLQELYRRSGGVPE